MTISETDLLTASNCLHLYNNGAHFTFFNKSQRMFNDLICDFYNLVITNRFDNFDDTLFKLIKRLIRSYYPNSSEDDFQVLNRYLIDATHQFLSYFSLDKYTPIITNYNPKALYKDVDFTFSLDLLFTQNNKSKYFHGVCFLPIWTPHFKELNCLNYVKLKFLSNLYTSRRNNHPAAYLHLVYLPEIKFNNKNLKHFNLKFMKISEKEILDSHLNHFDYLINSVKNINNTFPILGCANKTCPKRKECQNESW